MTVSEIRLVAVFGLIAIGVVAVFASLAVVHLQGLVRHLKNGEVRDLARLIDRRQAAWRPR